MRSGPDALTVGRDRELSQGCLRLGPRTHVSTTDRLDCVYTPVLPVAAEFRSYFEPTAITTPVGDLHPPDPR